MQGQYPPQAVSSKRMTYGAISSNNRESRERQELFAGADPYRAPYQQQQQQGYQQQQEEQSNDELMQQAVTTHKDTTATAKRALQVSSSERLSDSGTPLQEPHSRLVVLLLRLLLPPLQVLEQTKEIQGNTQAALYDQRQQMHRIESGLDKVRTPASLGGVPGCKCECVWAASCLLC